MEKSHRGSQDSKVELRKLVCTPQIITVNRQDYCGTGSEKQSSHKKTLLFVSKFHNSIGDLSVGSNNRSGEVLFQRIGRRAVPDSIV